VAAHQVASQLWLLLALVVDALAVAGQAMVARYRGQDDERAGPTPGSTAPSAGPSTATRAPTAREASNRLLLWGAGVGVALALGFLALRPWLPLLFTTEPAAIARVQSILPFVIWMQPLNALVFVWDGIFMGAEDFRFLAVQMVAAAAVAVGILLAVVPLGLGLQGVWWGIVGLMATRAVGLGLRYAGLAGRRVPA
jgi:Na+-driven multidrug efflux pump